MRTRGSREEEIRRRVILIQRLSSEFLVDERQSNSRARYRAISAVISVVGDFRLTAEILPLVKLSYKVQEQAN